MMTGPMDYEELSDFAIVLASGEKLKCHKLQLARASHVFDAMFKNGFLETVEGEVTVDDFDDATVKAFLNFIYLRADGRETKRTHFYDLPFLQIITKYQVKDLGVVEECIRHLIDTMDEESVVDSWIVGDMCSHDKLRDAALQLLLKLNAAPDKHPMNCKGMEDVFKGMPPMKVMVSLLLEELRSKDKQIAEMAIESQLSLDQAHLTAKKDRIRHQEDLSQFEEAYESLLRGYQSEEKRANRYSQKYLEVQLQMQDKVEALKARVRQLEEAFPGGSPPPPPPRREFKCSLPKLKFRMSK